MSFLGQNQTTFFVGLAGFGGGKVGCGAPGGGILASPVHLCAEALQNVYSEECSRHALAAPPLHARGTARGRCGGRSWDNRTELACVRAATALSSCVVRRIPCSSHLPLVAPSAGQVTTVRTPFWASRVRTPAQISLATVHRSSRPWAHLPALHPGPLAARVFAHLARRCSVSPS